MGRGKGNRKSSSGRPSKSARRREALAVLDLAEELAGLPPALVAELPADGEIRHLVREARPLAGGARKRLVKFLAKRLRGMDTAPLLAFVASRRGSRLQERERHQRLERLRDHLLAEAAGLLAGDPDDPLVDHGFAPQPDTNWPSPALAAIEAALPGVDTGELRRLALAHARSRNKTHSRQIFRLLAAADERLRLRQAMAEESVVGQGAATSPRRKDQTQETS